MLLGIAIFSFGTGTVSYTHLLRIYQEKVQEKVLKDSELEALKQFIDDGDADKANAVSYTHLDVYKRQCQYNPECGRE